MRFTYFLSVAAHAIIAVLLSACGRTATLGDACGAGECACVFNVDCPEGFVCIDNLCVDRDDYVECLANGAQPEACNGRDDDCDGRIDEGLPERPCERIVGARVCSGVEVCTGTAGYVCDAPVPSEEVCDQVDNDCNGVVDDPFVDSFGQYSSVEHCGACGARCDALIPDAVETTCVTDSQGEMPGPRCAVVTCPSGTFANEAGTACLGLPDALCRPCATDDDCLGPDSQCLAFDSDERGCGRDCGPGSPYGPACPDGYVCADEQCRPVLNTCLCGPDSVGTTRSCRIDTCDGFETCEANAGGFDWGTCDISAWRESCDGIDNDCDGIVDNGFLNPTTGRYESDLHCGGCNNDCTRRWAPEVDHAVGGCDTSETLPECRIVACTTETIGGTVFEWVDVNGLDEDGCECRRRQGNTSQDDPDRGPFAQLTQGGLDENCDGIDGVIEDALFVRDGAPAGGDGSLQRPFSSIQTAVDVLPSSGRRYILVAEGVYEERVILREGSRLFGGYSGDFRRRDVLQLATIIQSPFVPGRGPQGTVVATGLGLSGTPTVFAGFHVYGADASGVDQSGEPGAASVALWVADSGSNLTLQNNVIRGGRGGAGGRGRTGATGFGRQDGLAVDGGTGQDNQRIGGPCPVSTNVAGGAGGRNLQCGADGRAGGRARCPVFNWNSNPVRGTQADFVAPTSSGDGEGGFHRSFDRLSEFSCRHVTESGFPSDFQPHNGQDGQDGQDGASGADGNGCRASFGSLVGGQWSPGLGSAGQSGRLGRAGGGGGAGGGVARFTDVTDFCNDHEVGATGGGGGAGGCGGGGGLPGGSGGASIALLITRDRPGAAPIVRDNRIERGPGGRGGDGGFGGPGGEGGRGGFGGRPVTWSGSTGGKGGDGGNGGVGGGGGGGCGGPSIGVLAYQVEIQAAANDFTVPETARTGGPSGAGGNAAPQGRGEAGGDRNVLLLQPCSVNGACPAGTTCDANQVCVP